MCVVSMGLVGAMHAYPVPPWCVCRYAVSKTALLGLTKALAEELGPDGIRVNCLAPGIVPTKASKGMPPANHAGPASHLGAQQPQAAHR